MARSLTERMMGAAKLDVATYEEVEADSTATTQAAIVVGIVAVAQAIGMSGEGLSGIITGLIGAFIGWLLWAGVTYLIGDKILGGTATWGELLRTIGFAQAPGVLYVLGILPLIGGIIGFIVAIWILVAGIIAIRQALDFGTGKAILTAVLGWLAVLIPMALVRMF
ncbi:MAG TPA: YIP1 family protein [Longimicrobiaceae bacterium]|nr:YIP1 family protein [Longimicrobiaceae bacterium]